MKSTIETQLIELEKKYWRAIRDKDVQTALSLTDYPCIVAGAQGVGSIGREDFIEMMESASYKLHQFKISDDDAQVRLLSDDVAVLAYTVHEDLTVDGKQVVLEAIDVSTWVRRDGRWLCAMHSEAIQGDPYGRDRVQNTQFKKAV